MIASTIAVPSGTFIPVLKLGACLGRLIGESIHLWFPYGVYFAERLSPIIPGKTLQFVVTTQSVQIVQFY